MGISYQPADTIDVLPLLTRYIQETGLVVGDRLPPLRELCDYWKVKLQTVRDGISQARRLGLVEVRPQSGIYVSQPELSTVFNALQDALALLVLPSDQNVLDLIEARRLIEIESAGAAAVRRRLEDMPSLREAMEEMENAPDRNAFVEADNKFHLRIVSIAGNDVHSTVLSAYLTLLTPLRRSLVLMPELLDERRRNHREIYDSILVGDEASARGRMREHFIYDPKMLLAYLASRAEVSKAGAPAAE